MVDGWWWLRTFLVFSLSLDQAEQFSYFFFYLDRSKICFPIPNYEIQQISNNYPSNLVQFVFVAQLVSICSHGIKNNFLVVMLEGIVLICFACYFDPSYRQSRIILHQLIIMWFIDINSCVLPVHCTWVTWFILSN